VITFTPMTQVEEWNWVTERARCMRMSDTGGIVAYDGDGQIQAICVFDSFTVDNCTVHLAIDNPLVLRHGFLNEVARHLFHVCDRKRLFGMARSDNAKANKFNEKIGWKVVATIPDGFADGIDFIVYRMDRDECRWLNKQKEAA